MPKRRLALIAAAAAIAALSLSFVLMRPKSSPGVNVRLVKVERKEGAVVVIFEITSHTSAQYALSPVRLEMKHETGWKKCSGAIPGFSEPPSGTNMASRSIFYLAPQSSGAHLRLVADVQRARQGLGGFWDRLRLRLSGYGKISLNPSDTTSLVFTKEGAELITEEFIEP